jgi:SAM-dependent methyltransferase
MQSGDFSGLASNYSNARPSYAPSVLTALRGLLNKPGIEIDFVDVGSGTGIWTRLVVETGVRSAVAVEPNVDMRETGQKDSANHGIRWFAGTAEQTGLPTASADWLTMASSFHWVNTQIGLQEFHRVLRPGGIFTALWNPRLVEVNPLLVDIEAYLNDLAPQIQRVSSGRSGITATLTELLSQSDLFEDVVYIEGRHIEYMSPHRYLNAWKSVNDLQVQLGPERFEKFLTYVGEKVANQESIEATYLTRSWSARRKGN